jgi:hypothetical protein
MHFVGRMRFRWLLRFVDVEGSKMIVVEVYRSVALEKLGRERMESGTMVNWSLKTTCNCGEMCVVCRLYTTGTLPRRCNIVTDVDPDPTPCLPFFYSVTVLQFFGQDIDQGPKKAKEF